MQLQLFGLSPNVEPYDFKRKSDYIGQLVARMLSRTCRIFKYDGLPDTIPRRYLEYYLQINGHVCIAEHEGKLYAFFGNFGGIPDAYYMPTEYIVSNPYLEFSHVYTIGKDCIVIPNDSSYLGLSDLHRQYASLLAENTISLRMASVNCRTNYVIDAPTDDAKTSAEIYLKNIEDGQNGVIGSKPFFDGIRVNPTVSSGHGYITQLIELQQYIKASWYNDIGLQANYNMKRESINADEAQLNDDMLTPLIDDMLLCRQGFFDKVNDMFDTNIEVSLDSAWKDNEIERGLELDGLSDIPINGKSEESGESSNNSSDENSDGESDEKYDV